MTVGLPQKLLRVTSTERRLLAEAATLLVAARTALWVLPYRRVQRRFSVPVSHDGQAADEAATARRVSDVARAVRRASRAIPAASCLTQALAARAMLGRRGVTCALCFGVAKHDDGTLEAHAWVEHDGRVVLGRLPNMERFARLTEPVGRRS